MSASKYRRAQNRRATQTKSSYETATSRARTDKDLIRIRELIKRNCHHTYAIPLVFHLNIRHASKQRITTPKAKAQRAKPKSFSHSFSAREMQTERFASPPVFASALRVPAAGMFGAQIAPQMTRCRRNLPKRKRGKKIFPSLTPRPTHFPSSALAQKEFQVEALPAQAVASLQTSLISSATL